MNGSERASAEEVSSTETFASRSSLRLALSQLLGAPADAQAIERIVDTLGVPAALLDERAVIRWTSGAFDALLGEHLPPGTDWHRYIPNSIDHDRALLRARRGEVAVTVCPRRDADPLRLRYAPLRGSAGEVVGFGLSMESLAAQRAAEEALRQTHFLLQQVGAATQDRVLILDRELRVLYSNRKILNLSPEQLVGRPLGEVVAPEAYRMLEPALQRARDGPVERMTLELADARGELMYFDVRLVPMWREGKLFAITLIGTEVTAQLRAERAIAMQARMIESMLEGVAMVNDAGVIEISNPAFDAMFGYRRGELIGRKLSELATRPLVELDNWSPAVGSEKPASMQLEFEARRRDGSVFAVTGILSRFEVGGRHQNLLVLQDVSERKQLERAISQAVNREQYRIGNDLHDGLGQELTGIALLLRSLAGRMQEQCPALLPDIDSITQLVNNAVESTRALARGLSPVNLERGGLKDALDALAMHAREIYGVHVAFAHRLGKTRPLAPELANQLYRIAQEAVRNAVRHGNARLIRLHLSMARGKVRLVIADDGSGLPAEALEAPGMGLKIMRYRARMVGGEVRFEAAEPHGTRVICECPVELAAQPDGSQPFKPARCKRAGQKGNGSGA